MTAPRRSSGRPRIRSIKPEAWHDERLGQVSREARLLWVALITLADDEGRFRALPAIVVGHAYPYDDDALAHLERWMTELQAAGLLVLYSVGVARYGAFPKWTEHQRIEKPSLSALPAPNDPDAIQLPVAAPAGTVLELSGTSRGPIPVGREGKGRDQEGKGEEPSRASALNVGRGPTDSTHTPDLALHITGVLQRGIDSIPGDDNCKPPTRGAVAAALSIHQPSDEVALAVAIETRSIAQSQGKAPNIVGLFARRLAAAIEKENAA